MDPQANPGEVIHDVVKGTSRIVLDVLGPTVKFLTSPAAAHGDFCVMRGVIPPGVAVPLHSLLMLYARARRHLPATRSLYSRYLIFWAAGGAVWLSSLAAGGALRYAVWATALLTDTAGALAILSPSRQVPLNPWHLADRFQLFVLIVLGESVARL